MTGDEGAVPVGRITRISGPTVVARGLQSPAMFSLVRVGHIGLVGEIIRLEGDNATIQVYEDTGGLGPGEPVLDSGRPLTAELGPGLLGSLFDGVQRPLDLLLERCGPFICRGTDAPSLPRTRSWCFEPSVVDGARVQGGDVIGTVRETPVIEHRILVPPGIAGRVASCRRGDLSIEDPVLFLEDGTSLTMMQHWPVRIPRPVERKIDPDRLFLTGQRILDTFFPLAEGGTAAVPGGFGTGKTVVQNSLARYSAADVIVFIGCGERGNEIAEVLTGFTELTDPFCRLPLINRTVIIANTSNMPVAAREASLYTGVTIAEYYRDQGYRVALMADSISRWAESLREISSRLEELPGEEGYPTYLSTRLASYTERAGRVACAGSGEREGSVTMISAVSPPGGDFSEPVAQAAMRVVGALWVLDPSLAHRRHFPAVNPRTSYSLYHGQLREFLSGEAAEDWTAHALEAMALLQKEDELREVVQLVGIDSIPDRERVVLETGKLIREGFLAQNAFHPTDAFCSLSRQYEMLDTFLRVHHLMLDALDRGVTIEALLALPLRDHVSRMKDITGEGDGMAFGDLKKELSDILEDAARKAEEPPSGEEGSP